MAAVCWDCYDWLVDQQLLHGINRVELNMISCWPVELREIACDPHVPSCPRRVEEGDPSWTRGYHQPCLNTCVAAFADSAKHV